MRTRIVISVLVLALLGVSAAWGYSEWQRRQPPVAYRRAPAPAARATPARAIRPLAPRAAAKAEPAEGTRFLVEYVPPQDPVLQDAYDFSRKVDLYTRLPEVAGLSGMFELPRPLKLVTAECRQVNAFYDRDNGELVLCYEMIDTILAHAQKLAEERDLGEDFPAEYLLANLRFIMLHEMGHALIDVLDLSTTGREEDAADQLATTLMLTGRATDESPQEVARNLHMAASFFMAGADPDGSYDLGAYADEHSLGEQRYFNVLCLLYGRDPARYLTVVTRSGLPEARAMRCPDESRRVTSSWARLLTPHFAPKYRMSVAEAEALAAKGEASRRHDTPYVRGDAPPSPPATAADEADDNPYTR